MSLVKILQIFYNVISDTERHSFLSGEQALTERNCVMKYVKIISLLFFMAGFIFCDGCMKSDETEITLVPDGIPVENGAVLPESVFVEEEEKDGTAGDTVYIHLCGAVENPGVYEVPSDSRLVDAVNGAGGLLEGADVSRVNLAVKITDGMQVYIPYENEPQPEEGFPGGTGADDRIDINRADTEELCRIPGVGESRAEAIIAFREDRGPFQKIEDIMKVPGIKQGMFDKMKDKIRVQ